MDLILQKLFEIKKRPELYINKKSLKYLRMYISGYLQRQYEIDNSYRTPFDGFSSYVNEKYNYGSNALDWERILHFVIGDDEKAFDVFFELLEEYIAGMEQ